MCMEHGIFSAGDAYELYIYILQRDESIETEQLY